MNSNKMLFQNYNNNLNPGQNTFINNNTNGLFNISNPNNNNNTNNLFGVKNRTTLINENDYNDFILFLKFKEMKREYERENKSNIFNCLQKEDYSKSNNNIFLNIFIQINQPYQIIFMICVSNKLKLIEFKQQVIENLIQLCPIYKNFNLSSFLLLKNYELININENNLIEDCNLKNEDKIYILPLDNNTLENINNQKLYNENSQFVNLNKIPKLTKYGYKTNPPQYLFSRMTYDELRNVENFSIENENGKIKFKSKVNLISLNLDKLFDIIPGEIIIYQKNSLFYPPPGLNVKATIHLYNIDNNNTNIFSKDSLSLQYQIDKIKNLGIYNYKYNTEKKEFIYNVEHFFNK